MIENETLQIIREQHKNIKIAEINVDALWVDTVKNYLLGRSPFIDAMFLTTSGSQLEEFKKINPNLKVSFIANPVDESIETGKVFENTNSEFDVFFAGRGAYREATISNLITKLPDTKFNVLGQGEKLLTYGSKYTEELLKCAIGLNLPQFPEDIYQPPLYSSDRISHLFGNGLLTIIHSKTQYQTIFEPDVDAIFYNEWEDLAEKIHKYTLNKINRKTIAKNGWSKYYMLYNSKKITQDMVDLLVDSC